MSVRGKPITGASGDITELCSKPQGQRVRQVPRHERYEISVLNAVIDSISDPFAVADKFARIVLQNIHWELVGARSSLCADITDDDEAL